MFRADEDEDIKQRQIYSKNTVLAGLWKTRLLGLSINEILKKKK